MAEYDLRYRLDRAPTGRNDGSGCLDHDIWYESRVAPDGDWSNVPGRHKTVCIPADEIEAALDAGTQQQVVAAYKAAISANFDTQPVPITGWEEEEVTALLDANAYAAEQAQAVYDYVTITMGETFPVHFQL